MMSRIYAETLKPGRDRIGRKPNMRMEYGLYLSSHCKASHHLILEEMLLS